MAFVFSRPEALATTAADVAAIGTTISDATTAAADTTKGVAAAAADEVSEAIAALFRAYAREGHAAITQIAALHAEFAQALAAAGNAYSAAEAACRALLQSPAPSATGGAGALMAIANDLVDPYVTLVMSGSGTPIPPQDFVTNIVSKYVTPNFPAGLVQALALPAGEYPDSGIKDLTQDVSIARGVTILNNAIQQQLAAGNAVNVVGYSQSANIASLVMRMLDPTDTPSSLPINFVLLGNSMNPNGGWDARFPGLSLPSLGFTTLGAAPSNSFLTNVYTLEYDGWADFPRYPINILSDLNALAGMVTVHGGYASLTPAQIDSAIVLPTQGPTTTNYFMIPTQNLPLLDPLRFIPYVGDPVADLLQPVLRPIVNWGYGDPNYGWSTGPANIATPFGFLPPLSATAALGPAVLNGIPQGINAAIGDLYAQGPPQLPGMPDLLTPSLSAPLTVPTGAPSVTGIIQGLQAANTRFVGAATNALATTYSTLLPTADVATAALVSLPSYDFNLFLDGIAQVANGQPLDGLINAIGRPIAANVGLLPFLGGLELATLGLSADSILTGTAFPSQ
ncbi:hypothetical protein BST27_22140 [Mycobacterium intermedium]|uniref:PE family protein n=1 Tax=Mycobacterium intermedium TaxID=28445 RepID=A0A1E3SJC1_MYCIE|nr:PE-PPE domain-containing protein [Mycobacterium intermedium]MCV6963769.1 PE-PPE domain-containing protein [Mycobacterium intermedium]ODR02247.1 hypothetical protein BHQ20_05975 [Mycobacterium intermedium]OPE48377.1 hypothetical protein BV508_18315 [Mycobacterium intermedium]ORA97600.1 hypothetical protein BST27_22140 [Mycobacterium intermedium]